jgi:RNA polymerase sigma factor (sigma-70 family)
LGFVADHWRPVFQFAYRVTNSREEARAVVTETFQRAYLGQREIDRSKPERMQAWLLRIAVEVCGKRIKRCGELSFDVLDDIIRSDPTQVTHTDRLADPERNALLWELQQGCMTAVLSCLSAGERLAFTLGAVMGKRSKEAAAILGISPAAFKVRLSRSTKKISTYLAPRCGHINPNNPCHCPSRLGVALTRGFIRPVAGAKVSLRGQPPKPFERKDIHHDVTALYESLPAPEPEGDPVADIAERLRDGGWDTLLKKKKERK